MLDNLTFTPKQEVTISWHKPQDKSNEKPRSSLWIEDYSTSS